MYAPTIDSEDLHASWCIRCEALIPNDKIHDTDPDHCPECRAGCTQDDLVDLFYSRNDEPEANGELFGEEENQPCLILTRPATPFFAS
jgi:hypothetical protein